MIKWKRLGIDSLSIPDFKDYTKDFIDFKDFDSNIIFKNISTDFENIDEFADYINLDEKFGVDSKLVTLAQTFYNSGALIYAHKNTKSKKPIYLNYSLDKSNSILMDHNVIVADENSEISVIMDYNTEDESSAFHNGVTKIFVKDNAKVNIVKIQRLNHSSSNFDSNIAIVKNRGSIDWITVELGSELSASSLVTNLNGDNSNANLSSIYFGDENRKLDLSYTMNHFGIRSNSDIDSRGALKDKAQKVFRGNLDFKEGSTKSKGSEKEYVTLLDSSVKSDSIPILFCQEDDVEGEHSASAGQLSEEKLMYIMSRGLSEKEAKKLIVSASFNPIIDKIDDDNIKNIIDDYLVKRLSNE
ncbi:Fe-S cluster assembly protein SufD [Tepidibacter aestuarii]|uniref:Fe-S cluster assembly protein SufD n=1 Tax=Tepidibacter aestuarii TaxID=2925782 RepID=UPI0020BD8C9B|nr:Fe-S cluster assembly protein SufD [Tepidibacter aestuarii]CAH2214773.1 Fe-S cluster assembly protein SufD [Tepidibacter aestuarii]